MTRDRLSRRFVIFFLLVAASCGSSGGPTEVEGRDVYAYEFDFLWDEAQSELRETWRIEAADRLTKSVTTEWVLRLAPYRGLGTRNRLIVTFEPADEGKWLVKCAQESETNDEIEKPLDPNEASWSKSKNDGALAAKFVFNFDRRLRPNDQWKRETRR